MRCLALADAWRARGGAVSLLTHCPSPLLQERIRSSGFEVELVDRPYPDASDLRATLARLRVLAEEGGAPWLALDGYHFDLSYHRAIRSEGNRLLVIDDTGHLPAYEADLLLNQNLDAD